MLAVIVEPRIWGGEFERANGDLPQVVGVPFVSDNLGNVYVARKFTPHTGKAVVCDVNSPRRLVRPRVAT